MRNWKNWLLPVLACLAAAGLAALPLRLSQICDRTLSDAVHTELLGEDSNFPAVPPELAVRIWLLARSSTGPDGLTYASQVLEGEELLRVSRRVRTELRRLKDAGILPAPSPKGLERFSGSRVYLRDQADLFSAAFLELVAYDDVSGAYLGLYVDGESGQVLGLEQIAGAMWEEDWDLTDLGRHFLEDLGVAYEAEPVDSSDTVVVFRLSDARVLYQFLRTGGALSIQPMVDWEALDEDDGTIYGLAYGG